MNHNFSTKGPIFLWLLANLFFAFQFILRLSVSILREDIMQRFSVDASSLGLLAGYYYIGYAVAQIPLGIMLDRLSFRFVTSISICAASIGTMLFSTTDSWDILLFARFLIGVGSGVAFLSVTKIIKIYFDERFHTLLIGLSFTFGIIGAVFGSTPMKLLFDNFGYDQTFYILAIIGFIIAFMMLIFAKLENNKDDLPDSIYDTVKVIIKLILNPTIVFIGVCGGLMVGSLEGFADLWAIPFFNQIFGMSLTDSTTVTSFVYIGMCFGGPILALFANLFRCANITIFFTGILTVIIFTMLFYLPHMSRFVSIILMFILGILCCYQVLVFTVVTDKVESSSSSLAIAITQCINMSFGHFFHTKIGNSFSNLWDGTLNEAGNALYTLDNFIDSLYVIPIYCFIGSLGFVFFAIKNRRKKY